MPQSAMLCTFISTTIRFDCSGGGDGGGGRIEGGDGRIMNHLFKHFNPIKNTAEHADLNWFSDSKENLIDWLELFWTPWPRFPGLITRRRRVRRIVIVAINIQPSGCPCQWCWETHLDNNTEDQIFFMMLSYQSGAPQRANWAEKQTFCKIYLFWKIVYLIVC